MVMMILVNLQKVRSKKKMRKMLKARTIRAMMILNQIKRKTWKNKNHLLLPKLLRKRAKCLQKVMMTQINRMFLRTMKVAVRTKTRAVAMTKTAVNLSSSR